MGGPVRTIAASRSFLMPVLCLTAVLTLQSCKNHRAEDPGTSTPAPDQARSRAVFGQRPQQAPGTEARTPTHRESTNSADQPAESSKQSDSPQAPSSAVARNRVPMLPRSLTSGQRSGQKDKDGDVFLYYRPPNSRVGDPGELARRETVDESRPSPDTIPGIIYRWAETLLQRDLVAHMSLYAPRLERAGGLRILSREAVRREKERLVENLAGIRRFEIRDLRIQELSRGSAVAEFRTDWSSGVAGSAVSTASHRLLFRHINGQWKIQSEDDVQFLSLQRAR